MAIIISKDGESARKIEKTPFEKEDSLQKYIFNHPESLPLYEIKEDIKLLIVAREFSTNSGSIDALGIDKEGEIYIIETKLYKNRDKREIIAQVLDYGASLWHNHNDFEGFLRILDSKINKEFKMSLNQKLKDFFNIEDEGLSILLESIKLNLNGGNLKFVIPMDNIHSQLKDLIIYINQNSKFDIYGVELEYYKDQNYEIIIPKLYGAEVKKDIGISTKRGKWDEERFFEDAAKNLKENEIKAVKILYDFSKEKTDSISWGVGIETGSFSSYFSKISIRALYNVCSEGSLGINFGSLHDNEITEKYRDEFKKELERIFNIKFPADYNKKYPSVSIKKWGPKVNEFMEVIENLIK